MRRCAPAVHCTPSQLLRRPASPALSARSASIPLRRLSASRFTRSQASSSSPPPPPPPSDAQSQPTGAKPDQKSEAPASNIILRHQIPSYRFIHATIIGQLSIAFTVSPMILADEQFILNPTAPWLAFGLPIWAAAQWMLWRWFVRHWVVEIRALPDSSYEFDTLSRAFARVKTRTLKPTDLASRERVTAHTSILRVRNPSGYFLLNRRAEKLLKYNYDAVEEMIDPLPDQLELEAAAKAPTIEAHKQQEEEAKKLAAAAQYRPFKREAKLPAPGDDDEEKPKPPPKS